MIDLTPLRDALATLTESLTLIEETRSQFSEPMRQLMQRGLIQAFEYNYSLAIVMMTRFLQERAAVPDKYNLSDFPELIRVADEQQLLLSPFAKWKEFRQARNLTSHTYHQEKADAVAAIAPAFEREVHHLLSQLQKRLEN